LSLPKFLAITAQMGIQEREGLEIIPHLSARELAEVIVQRPLTVLDTADLIKAIAQAIGVSAIVNQSANTIGNRAMSTTGYAYA